MFQSEDTFTLQLSGVLLSLPHFTELLLLVVFLLNVAEVTATDLVLALSSFYCKAHVRLLLSVKVFEAASVNRSCICFYQQASMCRANMSCFRTTEADALPASRSTCQCLHTRFILINPAEPCSDLESRQKQIDQLQYHSFRQNSPMSAQPCEPQTKEQKKVLNAGFCLCRAFLQSEIISEKVELQRAVSGGGGGN